MLKAGELYRDEAGQHHEFPPVTRHVLADLGLDGVLRVVRVLGIPHEASVHANYLGRFLHFFDL